MAKKEEIEVPEHIPPTTTTTTTKTKTNTMLNNFKNKPSQVEANLTTNTPTETQITTTIATTAAAAAAATTKRTAIKTPSTYTTKTTTATTATATTENCKSASETEIESAVDAMTTAAAGAAAFAANVGAIKECVGRRCYYSLAYSIGSISLALGSMLQIPSVTDRITLQRGLFLTSLGFIYFVSLTDFCNKYLLETSHGSHVRKKYQLMMSDVLEITNKIVSAVQAFFSFLVGFIVCKSTCSKSFLYASHFLMEGYGWFGTAYFMYDIWSMYKVHTQKITDKLNILRLSQAQEALHAISGQATRIREKYAAGDTEEATALMNQMLKLPCNGHFQDQQNGNGNGNANANDIDNGNGKQVDEKSDNEIDAKCKKDGRWGFFKYIIKHPVMMIHHIFIGTFGLLVVTYIRGGGHCIYSYMFMMEFSTPFVSIRSILSTLRLKETRIYIINGLLMLATFFIFRVCMWPYVMWRYSIAIDASIWKAMCGLPYGCIISILVLFLPQIYWFYLMVLGAMKVFMPKHCKQSNSDEHRQNGARSSNLNTLNDKSNAVTTGP